MIKTLIVLVVVMLHVCFMALVAALLWDGHLQSPTSDPRSYLPTIFVLSWFAGMLNVYNDRKVRAAPVHWAAMVAGHLAALASGFLAALLAVNVGSAIVEFEFLALKFDYRSWPQQVTGFVLLLASMGFTAMVIGFAREAVLRRIGPGARPV